MRNFASRNTTPIYIYTISMKKFILDLTVASADRLHQRYVLLKLTHRERLPEMLPGQFVEVRVDGSPSTFLRRPISINFVDKEKNYPSFGRTATWRYAELCTSFRKSLHPACFTRILSSTAGRWWSWRGSVALSGSRIETNGL